VACSKRFVQWASKHNEFPKDFGWAFIRGFYESDGTYNRNRKHPLVRIPNANLNLLREVKTFLSKEGLNPHIYLGKKTKNHFEYVLVLNRINESIEFWKKANPCIKNPYKKEEVPWI